MNVVEIMSKNLVTVDKDENIKVAFKHMSDHSIRHLPVLSNKSIVGIISDRDIREAFIPQKSTGKTIPANLDDLKVENIMSKDLITISPGAHVEDVAKIFYELKIGSLPVVDDKRLLGIVTESDILAVFIEMMGILESSCRLDILLDKGQKPFDTVSNIITKNDGHIISVGIAPSKKKQKRICFFRLEQCNMQPITDSLKKANFEIISVLE